MAPLLLDWPKIFFPDISWGEKAIRPFIVYLFLLVAFRLSGKRELGQTTLFDFLIILVISNVVQNAIIGEDNSILGSFVGVATLLLMSYLLNTTTSRSHRARRLLEGSPALLVHDGVVIDKEMRKERVSVNDLFSALRQEGIDDLKEVRYAILELDGKISIIHADAPKPDSADNCVTQEIVKSAGIAVSDAPPHPDVA